MTPIKPDTQSVLSMWLRPGFRPGSRFRASCDTQLTQRDTVAASNTLTATDLAANPPVVLVIIVDRRRQFRGRILCKG